MVFLRTVRLRDVVILSGPALMIMVLMLFGALADYVRTRQFDDWWSERANLTQFAANRVLSAAAIVRAGRLEREMRPESSDPGIIRLMVDGDGWEEVTGEGLAGWEQWTDATLMRDGNPQPVRLRKRGDTSIHWATPKKSMTLRTSRGTLFRGYRQLALSVKDVVPQFLAGRLASEFDLLAPDTEITAVFFNDRFYGVFRFVEPIDESFLRRHGRMPGNLYEGEVAERGEAFKGLPRGLFHYPYTWERAAESNRPGANGDRALASFLSELHGGGFETHLRLMEQIDREEVARLLAYLLVVGDPYHMDNLHNQFWYADPSDGLLHPVPWDVRLLALADPPTWVNHFFQMALRDPFLVDRTLALIAERLERGDLLARSRLVLEEAQERFRSYLEYDQLRAGVIPDVGSAQSALEVLDGNLELLGEWTADSRFAFGLGRLGTKTLILDLESLGYAGADLVALDLGGAAVDEGDWSLFADRNRNGVLDASDPRLPGQLSATVGGSRLLLATPLPLFPAWDTRGPGIEPGRLHYRLFLSRATEGPVPSDVTPVLRNRMTGEAATLEPWTPGELIMPTRSWSPWQFPVTDGRTVRLAGSVRLGTTIRLGATDTLSVEPGATLVLEPGVSIIARGPVFVTGTSDAPIRFLPAYERQPWGAFAIQGPGGDGSILEHVRFRGGGGATVDGIDYLGMVNVHRARGVVIRHAEFIDNLRSDDSFHALHADVTLHDCRFERANGDAIDFDYSTGAIARCSFAASANDAIDLMSSTPVISDNTIVGSGDKGISIGEASDPLVFNNAITDSNLGIEVKDLSEPVLLHNTITGNRVGLNQIAKNWRYGGGGWAKLAGSLLVGNEVDTLRDSRSRLTLVGTRIDGDPVDGDADWLLGRYGLQSATTGAGRVEEWTPVPPAAVVYEERFVDDFSPIPDRWSGSKTVARLAKFDEAIVMFLEKYRGELNGAVELELSDPAYRYVAVLELAGRDVQGTTVSVVGPDHTVERPFEPFADLRSFRYLTLELPPGRYETVRLSAEPLPGPGRVDPRTGLRELATGRLHLRAYAVYAIPRR